MRGMGAFATFALTTAVIGLMIGLALRSGSAQSADSFATGTSQAFLPTIGLSPGRAALVHVSNLSTDPTSPAVRFNVLFVNSTGTALMPAVPCDLRAGESCTVPLSADQCGVTASGDDGSAPIRCEFRTVVTTDGVTAPPPGAVDGGSNTPGSWTTNLETIDRAGKALFITVPLGAMAIPSQSGTIGTDGGASFGGGGGSF